VAAGFLSAILAALSEETHFTQSRQDAKREKENHPSFLLQLSGLNSICYKCFWVGKADE
jgi:hypothetical protein